MSSAPEGVCDGVQWGHFLTTFGSANQSSVRPDVDKILFADGNKKYRKLDFLFFYGWTKI